MQFADALDRFFTALPTACPMGGDTQLGVPGPALFAVLRDHGVAHVFQLVDAHAADRRAAAAARVDHRGVHRRARAAAAGATYAQAVESFAPYDHVQDENPELRKDLVALARTAINLRIPAYVIVNNRAEGCAPLTIMAVAAMLLRHIQVPSAMQLPRASRRQ